ncbi:lysosomal alpha-mannosidase isoform X1 [Bradysia coprophila]|uniref:lysosomal alpha-mannosidase isoform X1 n=1 Tax=Bradysia coprophila TaxID=38358 RepID=UPI00187DBE2F|nr:lysosomal alpha-mannosidase isoform X1 [Bradysia coprophila]
MIFKVNVHIVVVLSVVTICTPYSVHLMENRFKHFPQDIESSQKLSRHYRDDGFKARRCGYEGCPKPQPNMINVHLVPHTHDDVGWLKTVDQYYYGSKTTIQKAGVQYILDSVVQQLISDPEKRFIYVESAFFFKWWHEQTDAMKSQVNQLVQEGRLEFIGGAWSMNDEATTHYQSIIDQFTWGLRKLNDTFGECGRPKIGWQIDPFGHSREMASIFAQMGYDGLFFGRLDHEDKRNRLVTRKPEFVWHGSANLGENADLFTGVLFNNYGPPPGFCFDVLCADEPIIDDKWSPDNNVNRRVDDFMSYVNEMTKGYRTNNVLITMGEDFNYQDARMWYKNLDKLILYSNERQKNGSNFNLFYSTPSCYLKSLHEANITWSTKSDDFFPYSSDPHAFWTGYFTSRPAIKRFERVGNHFLQICKQLTALTPATNAGFEPHLRLLREAMGVMQHHDAVTGTEKQHVAEDYARLLNQAMEACSANTRDVLNQITTGKNPVRSPWNHDDNVMDSKYEFDFDSCPSLNISVCEKTEGAQTFIVTLYNPLPHSTFQYVRIPVSGADYSILDYRGVPTPFQMIAIPTSVKNLHYRLSNATNEMVFLANELPPLGFKSYFISSSSNDQQPEALLMDQPHNGHGYFAEDGTVSIGNKYINLTFDGNGQLASVTSNGATSRLKQTFFYYEGAVGNNREFLNRSSGAYIFRPNSTERIVSDKVMTTVIKGPVVEEVHQVFNEWLSQVVRIYKDDNFAEFEWLVGEIPITDGMGKEIVARFQTDINSAGEFFTDSNGREMLKRVRNHRDTWKVNLLEQIAGNYYPVTTKIAIEDRNERLAILTDRSQGGTSLMDGSVDLMIHRRLLHDDAFGVDEALNETAFGRGLVVRGIHYLTFGSTTESRPTMAAQERFIQLKKLLPSWIFFSDATKYTFDVWQKTYTHIYSALSLSLPQNVNLMTLEPWKENSFLLRFEHILEGHDDPEYSKPAMFNLKDVFHNFDISEIRETTLSANQWKDEATRMKFKNDDIQNPNSSSNESMSNPSQELADLDRIRVLLKDDEQNTRNRSRDVDAGRNTWNIILQPMEIRTFIVTLEWRP